MYEKLPRDDRGISSESKTSTRREVSTTVLLRRFHLCTYTLAPESLSQILLTHSPRRAGTSLLFVEGPTETRRVCAEVSKSFLTRKYVLLMALEPEDSGFVDQKQKLFINMGAG